MLSVLVEAALALPAASTAPPAGTAAITVPALVAADLDLEVVLSVVVTALTVARGGAREGHVGDAEARHLLAEDDREPDRPGCWSGRPGRPPG